MTEQSVEEQIEILANGDDLLIRLYTNSETARDAAWRKRQAAQESAESRNEALPTSTVDHPDDVLVTADDIGGDQDRMESDNEVDSLLDGIDILDAYARWCGKMTPDPQGQRESIKISCPKPGHTDARPSAWVNLDKQVWVCGTCGFEGGDKFDIAAWHFGYDVPGYKIGKSFPDLRRKMAEDLGYTVRYTRGGHEILEAPYIEDEESSEGIEDSPSPADSTEPPVGLSRSDAGTKAIVTDVTEVSRDDSGVPAPTTDDDSATVTHIFGDPEPIPEDLTRIDLDELKKSGLFIDWEHLALDGTFLGEWMKATCVDHTPDEYLFFTGLQALGFATGMNRLLDDAVSLVKPGLFVVLYGGTGAGKSRAIGPLTKILRDVLPWPDHERGVNVVPTPGSGEVLIDSLSVKSEITSGSTPEEIEPARHWLSNNEFASLTAIANRTGSTLKTVLMDLHDMTTGTSSDSTRIISRGAGLVEAKDKFFQVTTAVQPGALAKYTTDTDVMSGFLNRWVFATGQPRRMPTAEPPRRDLSAATRLLRAIRDWADEPELVPYSDGAREAWSDFYHEEIAPAIMRLSKTEDVDMIDQFMARMELTLKRLILLLAINDKSSQIEVWHVASAIELADYLKRSMFLLNKDFIRTFSTEVEDAVIKYLDRRTKPARSRQMVDALKHKYPRPDIRNSLNILLDLGVVKEVKIQNKAAGKTGPSATGYLLASDSDDGDTYETS